ncbi:MAG: ankyrin repeat domain-containing protein [Acidobacteria bacterium]|nr:ankyrin repeat domain-containing protein [Acidobacteriota bacterium]
MWIVSSFFLILQPDSLVKAAALGDLEAVKSMYRGVVDAETCDPIPEFNMDLSDFLFDEEICGNALMAAVAHGRADVVAWLIEQRFPLDTAQNEGLRAVDLAAALPQQDCLILLLKARADVSKGPFFVSPIEIAAISENLEAARLLLQYGAPIDDTQIPVVWFSVELGARWIELISDQNADLDAQVIDGRSILEMATSNEDEKLVQALLSHGADVDRFGTDALCYAPPSLIDLLIDYGAAVNKVGREGYTPLIFAVMVDDIDRVRTLLARGARVDGKGKNGLKPIVVARSIPVADLLLDHKARLSDADAFGDTLLHHAAWEGKEEVFKWAVSKGLQPNTPNQFGLTAADIQTLISCLYLGSGDKSQLRPRIATWLTAIRALADSQSELNLPDDNMLHYPPFADLFALMLRQYGSSESLEMLVDQGLTYKDFPVPDLLIRTVARMTPRTLRLFVRAGWDINAQDNDGETLLMAAVSDFRIDLVETAIALKADVNMKSDLGETALHKVQPFRIFGDENDEDLEKKRYDIARMLLMAGADPNAKNIIGMDVVTNTRLFGTCKDCPIVELIRRFQ